MTDDLRAKFEAWKVTRAYGEEGEFCAFQAAASLYAKDAERLREALSLLYRYVAQDRIAGQTDNNLHRSACAVLKGEPK
jgi:hypothetical protein